MIGPFARIAGLLSLGVVLMAIPPALAKPPTVSNRLAIHLDFAYSLVAMDRFDALVDDTNYCVEQGYCFDVSGAQATFQTGGVEKLGNAIEVGIAFRYYLPEWLPLFVQVGYDTVYAWGEYSVSAAVDGYSLDWQVEYHNLMMEIPVILGGYYSPPEPLERLVLSAGAGPAPSFYVRSFWDLSGNIDLHDYEADGGVGFHALLGADYSLAEHVAVGLNLRYRHARSGNLRERRSGATWESGMLRRDGSEEHYNLDFSGIGVLIGFRLLI